MTPGPKARRVWAVVPAAGRGERFEAPASAAAPAAASRAPKQYAPLNGASVLEWSLRPLLAEPRIESVVVVVAADDPKGETS